jgi:CDP-diacylglycerol--serine O-phosphatidyltransferase
VSTLRRLFPILGHANLANALTATNAACGLLGIFFAARAMPAHALLFGALAFPFDIFDGVVARRLGTSSEFGAQLDSLADAVSFVLMPAAMALAFGGPTYALLAALLYALAGLFRLARFGVVGTSTTGGREVFEGIPTLFAAAVLQPVAALALWLPEDARAPVLTAFYLLAAPAMVSSIPFPKRGLHTRAMWVMVPVALLAVWLRPR